MCLHFLFQLQACVYHTSTEEKGRKLSRNQRMTFFWMSCLSCVSEQIKTRINKALILFVETGRISKKVCVNLCACMRAPSKPEPRFNRLCRCEFGNTNYFPAVMSDLKQSARVISPCRMRGCTAGSGMHARSSPVAGLLRCSWGGERTDTGHF